MKALSLIVICLVSALQFAAAAPSNDHFRNATVLSGASLIENGQNFDATRELGEPEHLDDFSAEASVWYQWTAPADGFVILHTAGSDFDTILAIYTGSSFSTFHHIADNDEADNSTDHTSRVAFPATAGVTYKIAVDGFFGDTGNIVLTLNLLNVTVPPNDNYANADTLVGSPVAVDANNFLATLEPGEYNPGGDGGRSVWWIWEAPASGRYVISTVGSDFDTRLFVSADTTFIDWNDDDIGVASAIHFKAQAGVRYHIAVQGYGGGVGMIHLEIKPDPPVPAPDWTLTDMNGEILHLSDFAGKVVMLDFWATWCGPCISEIPDFIDMQNQYGPDGLVIIGVSTDEGGFNDVIPFVNANGVNYISTISNPEIEAAYGPVTAIPLTFIIDRQGMIDQRLLGSRPRETFESIIVPLLNAPLDVSLAAVREGTELVLKWPIAAAGYELESSTDLSSSDNWVPAGLDITVSGDLNVVRAPINETHQWFRLVNK